jgi:hypothetical protein
MPVSIRSSLRKCQPYQRLLFKRWLFVADRAGLSVVAFAVPLSAVSGRPSFSGVIANTLQLGDMLLSLGNCAVSLFDEGQCLDDF